MAGRDAPRRGVGGEGDDPIYRLVIARSAAQALAVGLPQKVATAAYELITGTLLTQPRRVGKPLDPPLAPAFAARRGDYRILYVIDEATRTARVTAVKHRADAYRT